ncbi:MAG: hypothetical protein ACOYM9_20000 [Bradymonadia bacterium]
MRNLLWRQGALALGLCLLGGVTTACDKVDEALDQAQSSGIVKGTVKDTTGAGLEGATVKVYTFAKNLNAFYRPEEPEPENLDNPAAYSVKVDLGALLEKGQPESLTGTTGADGTYTIEGLPTLEGLIVVATKDKYSVDIQGMNADDGTVSLASALKPSGANADDLSVTLTADFVLAGGPVADVDGEEGVPDNVDPVPPPPAPPTIAPPTAPPAPPAPECVENTDCTPGQACNDGVCGPECVMNEDCTAPWICRDGGVCGPECLGHDECADGEICDGETQVCKAEECNDAMPCEGLAECTGAAGHGRCAAACTEGGTECDADNKICDRDLGGCRYECISNADCGADAAGPLCENNRCAPAECAADDDCLAEGKGGGFCRDLACVAECGVDGAEDACGPRNMVCDSNTARCKLECIVDSECVGNPTGPLCVENRCAPAECVADDDCLAEGKAGGFCVTGRCLVQCTADGDIPAACGGDAAAECGRGRCIPSDPNELQPPAATTWSMFTLTDAAGAVLADASAAGARVEASAALALNGAVVRILGEVADTSGDTIAYLRVQHGDSHCMPVDLAPKVDEYPLTLRNGKIYSDKGDFQEFVVTGGYQQFQLDLDMEVGNGNESNLVTIADRCAPSVPPSNLIVTVTWDKPLVDIDLHVWNSAGEQTFYGSRFEGTRRRSSYGRIDTDDRNGYGPEAFTLDPSVTSGVFTIRANFFSGLDANAPANVQVRVVRKVANGWSDETFTGSVSRRGWVDLGLFGVGSSGSPIAP